MKGEDGSRPSVCKPEINAPSSRTTGRAPGIWDIWTRLKRYGPIRRVGRFAAHMCSIWTGRDLVAMGRKMSAARGFAAFSLSFRYERLCLRLNVEIPNFDNIGEGFILARPFAIVINPAAVIGKHCTVYKGATIGSIRSGDQKGAPTLEDRVVVHTNAVVAGGITIGHDSLIAVGALVDFDVPPHSVVIGNPSVIHYKENASRDYIASHAEGDGHESTANQLGCGQGSTGPYRC